MTRWKQKTNKCTENLNYIECAQKMKLILGTVEEDHQIFALIFVS